MLRWLIFSLYITGGLAFAFGCRGHRQTTTTTVNDTIKVTTNLATTQEFTTVQETTVTTELPKTQAETTTDPATTMAETTTILPTTTNLPTTKPETTTQQSETTTLKKTPCNSCELDDIRYILTKPNAIDPTKNLNTNSSTGCIELEIICDSGPNYYGAIQFNERTGGPGDGDRLQVYKVYLDCHEDQWLFNMNGRYFPSAPTMPITSYECTKASKSGK